MKASRAALSVLAVLALLGSCASPRQERPSRSASPLEKYKQRIFKPVGAAWYALMTSHSGNLALGTVRVEFDVFPSGKISPVKIVSNTGDQPLALMAVQAIQKAKIPPIPAEVLTALPERRLPVELSFTHYESKGRLR